MRFSVLWPLATVLAAGCGAGGDDAGVSLVGDAEDPGWFACSIEAPAPPQGNDFPMTLGLSIKPPGKTGTYDGVYTPVEDGAEVEIVKGIQCGVHLEVAYTSTLPERFAAAESTIATVRAATYLDCDAAQPAASGANLKKVVYSTAGSVDFTSGRIAIIFDGDEPEPYASKDCCMVMTVGIRESEGAPPSLWACDTKRFRCVDEVAETDCAD